MRRITFEDAKTDARIRYFEVYARGDDNGDYTQTMGDEYCIAVMAVDTPSVDELTRVLKDELADWQVAMKSKKPFRVVQAAECDRECAELYAWSPGKLYPVFGTDAQAFSAAAGRVFSTCTGLPAGDCLA